MKIIEVNITNEETDKLGLSPIKMKRIGNTVLFAGKTRSGKTRLLNLIRDQSSNLKSFLNNKDQANVKVINLKSRISKYSNQLFTRNNRTKIIESEISNHNQEKSTNTGRFNSKKELLTNLNDKLIVTKGAAEELDKKIKILQQNTISVGNDYNDIDMLEYTAEKFIVSNAPDELKSRFPICKSNQENGFTDVASQFFDIF